VILHGETVAESLEKAREIAAEGRMLVHPYDDGDIIAGQGTIGLEILEQLPEADLVVVPVGGGGLISGILSAIKPSSPSVRVVGVEPAACPSAAEALRKGRVVPVPPATSIADGITVKQLGDLPFAILKEGVEKVVAVREEEIAAAILLLLERKKILAEGAGAAPLAALASGAVPLEGGENVVLVISGGNVDSPLLGRIIGKGLIQSGRTVRLWIQLNDVPGALSRMLALVAELKANVLHIHHERYVRDAPLFLTRVELELETRGASHVGAIVKALQEAGYALDAWPGPFQGPAPQARGPASPSPSETHREDPT
jgi:threonine dehydratase